jgi:hypothetical protein
LRSRATAHRTISLRATMPLAMLRLLVGLQWHMSVAHIFRQTRLHCLETASVVHLAPHPQDHRHFHHPVATTVPHRREVDTRTTTARVSLPFTHQATPGAASTATVRLASVICLSTYRAVQQKLAAAPQVRILKTFSKTTAVRARKRGSRKISTSSLSCSGCQGRNLSSIVRRTSIALYMRLVGNGSGTSSWRSRGASRRLCGGAKTVARKRS